MKIENLLNPPDGYFIALKLIEENGEIIFADFEQHSNKELTEWKLSML